MRTNSQPFLSANLMDIRLKNLFSGLKGSIEPVDGQHGNGKNVEKPATAIIIFEAGEAICPCLNTAWDNTTCYEYPHEDNVCYRPEKPRPVSLAIQKEFCLTKQYGKCPLDVPLRKKKVLLSLFQGLIGLAHIR